MSDKRKVRRPSSNRGFEAASREGERLDRMLVKGSSIKDMMHQFSSKPQVLSRGNDKSKDKSYYGSKWNPAVNPVPTGTIVRLKSEMSTAILQVEALGETVNGVKIFDSGLPVGVHDIGAKHLWDSGYDGKGVYCAVLDTGIDSTHPDLSGKIHMQKSFLRVPDPRLHHHGTHVAGTIAANGRIKGVAPGARLIDVRVLNSAGVGYDDGIAKGLEWIISLVNGGGVNIRVVNMSLGGLTLNRRVHDAIVKLSNLGVLVCCAAGNEGDGNSQSNEFAYPAADRATVSVAAFDARRGEIARFSNSNSMVDCTAHGVDVCSTVLRGMYSILGGTSMACPHISGMACLFFQQLGHIRPELTPEQRLIEVKSRLLKWYIEDAGEIGKDNSFGFGIVRYRPPKPTVFSISEKPTEEKAVEEKPTEEKVVEEKPTEEKVVEENGEGSN